MSLDAETEPTVNRPLHLTRIEPATFRGVDCAVLAERYAAYLLSRKQEEEPGSGGARPMAAASSENV